jgi:peptide/nickel transport system permease protein
MLNENYGYAIGGKPILAMIPAFAIMLMVLAFNLVGNGFRDALDVKIQD